MKSRFKKGYLVVAGVFLVAPAYAADNCTGYDMIVTTSADTRDLGNGMTLTTFQGESMLSKYPPAKPGALSCEPLKAARRGR